MCKILITATNANVYHFLVPHIENLILHGHNVDLACTNLDDYDQLLKNRIKNLNVNLIYVRLKRSPFRFSNLIGIKDLKRIIDNGNYDLIWTNEPVMSVATRLAAIKARKKGTKVVYMAHGFHFFKGAPIKNWLVYYPIEKIFAQFTDVLITINKDDFKFAQKNIHAKQIFYIPGIGINLKKIESERCNREEVRKKIGVPEKCILLTSIGELTKRKNHQVVIKALALVDNPNIHYVIAGKGPLLSYLTKLSKDLGLEKNVHFLGYRTDVYQIYSSSDIALLPSLQEGLPVALMEAMAIGLPIICSKIRGNVDLLDEDLGGFLFNPLDEESLYLQLIKLISNETLRRELGLYNKVAIKKFGLENIIKKMNNILREL